MAAPRRVSDLAIGEEELEELEIISRSRTEPAGRVCRARMAYREDPSFFAVGVGWSSPDVRALTQPNRGRWVPFGRRCPP
jgi:hypothetical protein